MKRNGIRYNAKDALLRSRDGRDGRDERLELVDESKGTVLGRHLFIYFYSCLGILIVCTP